MSRLVNIIEGIDLSMLFYEMGMKDYSDNRLKDDEKTLTNDDDVKDYAYSKIRILLRVYYGDDSPELYELFVRKLVDLYMLGYNKAKISYERFEDLINAKG